MRQNGKTKKIYRVERVFLLLLVVAVVFLAGCSRSPHVEKRVEENGEEIVILKEDGKENTAAESTGREWTVESIKRLTTAEFAFYIYTGEIMIGRRLNEDLEQTVMESGAQADRQNGSQINGQNGSQINGQNGGQENTQNNVQASEQERETEQFLRFYIYDQQVGEETVFDPRTDGSLFQISPERNRLLFVHEDAVFMYDIQKSLEREKPGVIYWNMKPYLRRGQVGRSGLENLFLHDSVAWADNDSYIYSDRAGSIYVRNIPEKWTRTYELDSPLKLNLHYVDGKAVYLKKLGTAIREMDPNQPGYGLYLKNQPNQYLGFSEKDHMNDIILESSEELNIRNYWLSPDLRRIAVYLEDNENNGLLALAEIEGTLFSRDLRYNQLIHLSNKRIREFAWSRDGENLVYLTDEQIPGLYLADRDGKFNKQIIANRKITTLDWNEEGDTLLAVEREAGESYLYEIKIKAKSS